MTAGVTDANVAVAGEAQSAREAKCSTLVVGAGPSGYAVAAMLAQQGHKDIQVVDNTPQLDYVNVHRAYMYNLSPAGKSVLRSLGMTDVDDVGLTNVGGQQYTYVNVDGSIEKKSVFGSSSDASKEDVGTWMSRIRFLRYLHDNVERLCGSKVNVQYGTKAVSVTLPDETGSAIQVAAEGADGTRTTWSCRLLIAADGANSNVRKALAEAQPGWEMLKTPSKSAGLWFRGLPLPPDPVVKQGTDPLYNQYGAVIIGQSVDGAAPLRLGLLPSGEPSEFRSGNFIFFEDHPIWRVKTVDALYDYLERAFPQFDTLREIVSVETAQAFLDATPGRFPTPQHAARLAAVYPGADTSELDNLGGKAAAPGCGVVLLGDAAHVFPPDLGQGVNSALLDVAALRQHLEAHPGDLNQALRAYERERLPEHAALIHLQQVGYPYQYPAVRHKHRLSYIGHQALLIMDVLANKLLPFAFSPPPLMVMFTKDGGRYAELMAKRTSNRRKLAAVMLTVLVGLSSLILSRV